jgi:hypothetical protein
MAYGEWEELPATNTISDVVPSPVPDSNLGGEHVSGIVDSWCSGAKSEEGHYILCANGGHADYPGNELYRIKLLDENLTWQRMTDPTPNSAMTDIVGEGGGIYSDGRPRAMHSTWKSYCDGRVWYPRMNAVTSGGGGGVDLVVSCDYEGVKDRTTPLPYDSGSLGPWEIHGGPVNATYTNWRFGISVADPVDHYVYGFPGRGYTDSYCNMWRVSTAGGTYGDISPLSFIDGGSSYADFGGWGVYCEGMRLMVLGDSREDPNPKIVYLDLTQPFEDGAMVSHAAATGTITGTGIYRGGSGGCFDEVNKRVYVMDPRTNGAEIAVLQLPLSGGNFNPSGVWAWHTHDGVTDPMVDVNPLANNATHARMQFQRMQNGEGLIFYTPNVTGGPWGMRVPAAGL